MSLYVRKRRHPSINIVPLIDVLTTLIFFFMITMQFRDQQTMGITPPKIDTAGPHSSGEVLRIQVTKDGKFFIHDQPVTLAQLTAAMAEQAKLDHSQPILIEADQDTYLKNATTILDEARKLNFQKILLQSR